jgi:hypothetical protein
MNWKGDIMWRNSIKFIFAFMAMTLFLTPAWGSIPDPTDVEDQALTFFRNYEAAGTCVWAECFKRQPVLARGGGSGGGSGGGFGSASGDGYGNNGSHRMGSQGTNATQQNQHQYRQWKTNKRQNQTQHQYQQQHKTKKQNQHQYQYQHREESGAQN